VWGIYCLLPAFIVSSLVIVLVSLSTPEPDAVIKSEFDAVKQGTAANS
jgi:sodium/proline symporter